MISELQQRIYNSYLFAARAADNKPFRPRKDFSRLDSKKHTELNKLETIIKQLNVSPSVFFRNIYELCGNGYKDLGFFATSAALKLYTQSSKLNELKSPDSDISIEHTKTALLFIAKFCKQNDISVNNYLDSRSASHYNYVVHLKEHSVNFYSIHCFEKNGYVMNKEDKELVQFLIPNFDKLYNLTKVKYLNSKKLRQTATLILSKIKEKVK